MKIVININNPNPSNNKFITGSQKIKYPTSPKPSGGKGLFAITNNASNIDTMNENPNKIFANLLRTLFLYGTHENTIV